MFKAMRTVLTSIVVLSCGFAQDSVADKIADKWTPARFEDQRLGGYFANRMQVNLEKRLLQIEEEALLAGFRKQPGSHAWIGEHIGKYLHAASNTWRYTHDERLREQMTRMAVELMKCQKIDGYLGTYTDDQRWTSWDVWVHKYDLIGLLSYYDATGDERALKVSRKIGDLMADTFGPGKRDIIAASTHVGMAATSILEPICQLYRYTGEKAYLDFAEHIVRAWEQPNGPKLLSSLTTHGNAYRTANAKAYEMMSDLVGLLELHRITGKPEYLKAAVNAQADIAARRRYITGTVSSHEHFQDDGVLPGESSNDVGEGCATVTWLQLNWHLLRLTADAKYSDEIERTIYNQLLAAQNPANGNICYFTPVNGRKRTSDGINCCRSSEPRGISMIPQVVWGWNESRMAIEQIVPGEAILGGAKVLVQTDFPATGEAAVTVIPRGTQDMTLAIRVPSWAKHFEARVDGSVVRGVPGGYVEIARRWKPGDKVQVKMDVPTVTVEGGRSYPEMVALQRGPQVMAAVDSPRAEVDGAGTKWKQAPFADTPFLGEGSYRVWLYKPGRAPKGPAPASLLCREMSSSNDNGAHGSLCDERTDLVKRTLAAKPGVEDWFGVELAAPAAITRVVYVQGDAEGGFEGKPRVEVQAEKGGAWSAAGVLEGGELRLVSPVRAAAVRVIGKAAKTYVTCAELSVY